jgi:uncharacterized protein YndB with AHSA1/START domain
MGETTIRLAVDIARPPEAVFAALTHLGSMGDRLGRSTSYAGTVDVSDDPVRAGSTYTDRTPLGRLRGEVRELEPDRRVVFRQATAGGGLTVLISYDLRPTAAGTRLTRTGRITTRGALGLLHPIVVRATVAENRRTMARLRASLEATEPSDPR